MRATRSMLAIAVTMAIGAALIAGSVSDTTEAKRNKSPEVTFEFSTTYDGPQMPADIVALTLCAANIGSSGLDGVNAPTCESDPDDTLASSDWQIDSFFDVEYRLFGDPDFDVPLRTVDIELVALSLKSADPVEVLDRVEAALTAALKVVDHNGHVTVLK